MIARFGFVGAWLGGWLVWLVSLSVCLPVCLSVCTSVRLSASLCVSNITGERINLWIFLWNCQSQSKIVQGTIWNILAMLFMHHVYGVSIFFFGWKFVHISNIREKDMSGFPWSPFYLHGLIFILAWISNYIHNKVWDEITYLLPNFNGATVEV